MRTAQEDRSIGDLRFQGRGAVLVMRHDLVAARLGIPFVGVEDHGPSWISEAPVDCSKVVELETAKEAKTVTELVEDDCLEVVLAVRRISVRPEIPPLERAVEV